LRAHFSTSRWPPRAAVLHVFQFQGQPWARPLQHVEVASPCCPLAGPLVPGAAVGDNPLQHLQVTSLCCLAAGPLVPGGRRILSARPRPRETRGRDRPNHEEYEEEAAHHQLLNDEDTAVSADIKDLEGLVQRAGYESVASIAERDHLHWTLVAS
jgi:hypothetical protein